MWPLVGVVIMGVWPEWQSSLYVSLKAIHVDGTMVLVHTPMWSWELFPLCGTQSLFQLHQPGDVRWDAFWLDAWGWLVATILLICRGWEGIGCRLGLTDERHLGGGEKSLV